MLVYLTSFTDVFSGDVKKSSENDQLTGHFQSFLSIFFRPHNPKSDCFSLKSTNKKIWPKEFTYARIHAISTISWAG